MVVYKIEENFEDDIIEEQSKQIREEIDWEIMASLWVSIGWTKVILPQHDPWGPTSNVNNWLHRECTHHWLHRGKTWLFENKDEAALFKLTWS